MTILELREKRNKVWEGAKAFLDSHRSENGILSAEDDATYSKMEQDIENFGREIDRLERVEAMDKKLAQPITNPLYSPPEGTTPENKEKTGRFSEEYNQNFWNAMKTVAPDRQVLNTLTIGTDSEGGYLVPDEFEKTLVDALTEENILRSLAKVIKTASGDRKIPLASTHGEAFWTAEGEAYGEGEESFGQATLGSFKLTRLITVSEELLNDGFFDIESYIASEFGRSMGAKEEEAFFTGDGTKSPKGFLDDAEVGVTSASATAITMDEIMDLFYSLRSPYRKNATWIVNDSTIKALRKLKDSNGQYLWQPAMTLGAPDMLLGKPVKTSIYMPEISSGAKSVAFGDFKNYWIADRQGRSFKRLNELYAVTGKVGFLTKQRVDAKLLLPESIKVLTQKGG